MKKLLLICISFCISSCAHIPPKYETDKDVAYTSVNCNTDSYTNIKSCDMPPIDVFENRDNSYRLFIIKAGKEPIVKTALIVYLHSKDWGFYKSVRDSHGNALKVSSIDSQARGYEVIETLTIELNWKYLEEWADYGLNLRAYGKGTRNIHVPAPYLRGFIDYINDNVNFPEN